MLANIVTQLFFILKDVVKSQKIHAFENLCTLTPCVFFLIVLCHYTPSQLNKFS